MEAFFLNWEPIFSILLVSSRRKTKQYDLPARNQVFKYMSLWGLGGGNVSHSNKRIWYIYVVLLATSMAIYWCSDGKLNWTVSLLKSDFKAGACIFLLNSFKPNSPEPLHEQVLCRAHAFFFGTISLEFPGKGNNTLNLFSQWNTKTHWTGKRQACGTWILACLTELGGVATCAVVGSIGNSDWTN